MGIFLLLFLIPMTVQHITFKKYRIDYQKKNKAALTFFFIGMTLLVMLRHQTVGSDSQNYIWYFKKIVYTPWENLDRFHLEYGYVYLNKIVARFSDNPQVFLAVAALLTSAMIYPTYRRACEDASLTMVLFCTLPTFVMMFSGLRQMLAIGIGFIAYECTRTKKLYLFIPMVLLAMCFHTSAFMLAFMYPLYHIRIKRNWLYVIIPVLITILVFNTQIFSALTVVLAQFTGYETGLTKTGAYTMLILFAAFTIYAFWIPDEANLDPETIGLRNFLLLALVIQMFAPLHNIAMRMNYYYIIFLPLLLPRIVERRSERWNQIAILSRHIMLVFFLGYFFFSAYTGVNLNVFPYHFFWEFVA